MWGFPMIGPLQLLHDLRSLRWRRIYEARWQKDYTLQIGSVELWVPGGHRLHEYLKSYRLYDQPLKDIAKLVGEQYPDAWFVDIGANIGDSAVAMRAGAKNRLLCIEGCEEYYTFLKLNTQNMEEIRLEQCFVAGLGNGGDSHLCIQNGTASVRTGPSGGTPLKFCSLLDIFNRQGVDKIALIKIDTDGMDCSIIQSSLAVLRRLRPICFFEYDPSLTEGGNKITLETIVALSGIGYTRFIVYDNFGNFMSLVDDHVEIRFKELNQFLSLNRRYSRQNIAYLDICAVHESRTFIADKLLQLEMAR